MSFPDELKLRRLPAFAMTKAIISASSDKREYLRLVGSLGDILGVTDNSTSDMIAAGAVGAADPLVLAIALRKGADPNMYIPVPGRGKIHLFVYMIASAKAMKSETWETDMMAQLLAVRGVNLLLPASTSESQNVLTYVGSTEQGLSAVSSATKAKNPELNELDLVAILLDDPSLFSGNKNFLKQNMGTALIARSENIMNSTKTIPTSSSILSAAGLSHMSGLFPDPVTTPQVPPKTVNEIITEYPDLQGAITKFREDALAHGFPRVFSKIAALGNLKETLNKATNLLGETVLSQETHTDKDLFTVMSVLYNESSLKNSGSSEFFNELLS
jgi:hypothetical protein